MSHKEQIWRDAFRLDDLSEIDGNFLLAIAAMTKTKINNGATARSERTKIWPSTPTSLAKLKPSDGSKIGVTRATTIPKTKPMAIRLTKLP